LLLGLSGLALVVVTAGGLMFSVRDRIEAGAARTAARTHRLTAAGQPLLLNALVVGDLATVEQTLRNLNADVVWREVKLYEPDGVRLILDASPAAVPSAEMPELLRRLLRLEFKEMRLPITAEPVVYAVLGVTPTSELLETELWREIRSTLVIDAVLLVVLLAVMHVIMARGLRPVQNLGRTAERFGAGDFSVRMPETPLVEIAPTVHAFNTMAANIQLLIATVREREAERERATRRQAAQFGVTRILAEGGEPGPTLERLLATLGTSLGWDWGEVWLVDPDADALRYAHYWHTESLDAPDLAEAARTLTVGRGLGLTGGVWATGQPQWSSDLFERPTFRRRHVAARLGLRTALAFPIIGSRGVVGVMLFFSREVRPVDELLLAATGDLGAQVGQFLERKEGEAALRRAEEQLQQWQKLEAIGRLAGGVAHDFNNLLTVIIGRCEMLKARATDEATRPGLALIHQTAQRAAALTRQLLAFSRKQVLRPQPLDLNAVVEGIAPMLRRLIGEDVELETRLAPRIGRVSADPSQLEQVIVNLAVNARDAMPHGGRLTMATAPVELDAGYVRRHPGSQIGRHVKLEISDTGHGMSPETLARIFEPFFTTKPVGQGTGLGLSTVYGIVKQSGGGIWAYSEPGRGTVFKVYLPVTDADAGLPETPAVPESVPRGTETILLSEDEAQVRELARDVLTALGYTVLEAKTSIEAVSMCSTHPGAIDLLLTDVVMPGFSGPELADRLAADRPTMKTLFMSGYTDHAIVHRGVLADGVAYLEKPFTVETLGRTVREVLDRR
jgi:signal transduction histidine kinase